MRKLLIITLALTLLILASTSTMVLVAPTAAKTINYFTPYHTALKLDKFATVGGVPFCKSGGFTIICYPPNFLTTAYDFPPLVYSHSLGTISDGLNGTGSTIVIVDAFGSPFAQSDLNLFDTTYGLPPTTVTILCPPSFTGAASDLCPWSPGGSASGPLGAFCGTTSWAEETDLDLAMSHGMAPGAKLVLVEANSCFDNDLYNSELAVFQQPALKGSIMSQSFGEPEDTVPAGVIAQWELIYNIGRANGWTVLASSADDGANTNLRVSGTAELTPSWPATSPLVLAIGGTQGYHFLGDYGTFNPANPAPPGAVTCPATATCNTGLVVVTAGANGCAGPFLRPAVPSDCSPTGYGGEGAWNEATNPLVGGSPSNPSVGRSTGGGISQLYTRPDYQTGLPNTWTTLLGGHVDATNKRLNPDVAFNAATDGGIPVPFSGLCSTNSNPNCPAFLVFGGTSASSPAWAGIIALLNEANGGPVGFINPAIYALGRSAFYSTAFHDIIHGNNSDTAGFFSPGFGLTADGFTAGTGYDLTTGWGTPDVTNLLIAMLSANPFYQMTVNLRLLSYKIVNVQVQVLKGAVVVASRAFTLSPGGPTATTIFYGLVPFAYTVKISGYSIATQTQSVPIPGTAIANFNIH